ncbi:hypothetical protein KC19_VG300000 [Ceratodon purpureus]|uniref:Uncharacterized protein n=1 Tax=Ceratodon purpureus TaxID=3225 RepID=A0A8T0HVM2_CERPU|nr:hypothetical protein KC19_VG300000 [Ceratodon purpureus]
MTVVFSEIQRVMKAGGKYMLITYGNPLIRMPWLKTLPTPWKSIILHVFPRPGSPKALKPSPRDILEPVYMLEDLTLGPQFNLDDPDWHYIYICTKENEDTTKPPPNKAKKVLASKGGKEK